MGKRLTQVRFCPLLKIDFRPADDILNLQVSDHGLTEEVACQQKPMFSLYKLVAIVFIV